MGKKRSMGISRLAESLIKSYPDIFTKNFVENKEILNKLSLPDKFIRNKVAGEITHIQIRGSVIYQNIPAQDENR